jgi:hypothetical protein
MVVFVRSICGKIGVTFLARQFLDYEPEFIIHKFKYNQNSGINTIKFIANKTPKITIGWYFLK